MEACVEQLENTRVQLENAKAEVQKPFPQEEELAAKTARLNELNALLNLDKKENEIVDGERGEEEPQKSSADRERKKENHSGNVEYLHCRCDTQAGKCTECAIE